MKNPCLKTNDFGISIVFQDSSLDTQLRGYLGSLEPELSVLLAGEKNDLWHLRDSSLRFLRSQDKACSRSFLRRCPDFSGDRGPACFLSKVPEGETRKAGLVGQLSLLHQAVCLLCGASLPGVEHPRCSQGAAFGLEDSQGLGNAVHARAVAQDRQARSQSDWGG